MRISRVLFLAAATLVAASTTMADTYYVDDGGSDSNAGTFAAPFRTITHGLTFIDGPGDVLYVRAGTYAERVLMWNKNGASGNEIRIAAYNGERPVIDATNIPTDQTTVSINQSSYLQFTGFIVKNSPKNGIKAWDAHHITIASNTVKTSAGGGISVGADVFGNTYDIVIRGNVVSDTVRSNAPGTGSSGWVQAVSTFRADNVLITGNWVYENYGEGIDCILSDRCKITNNTVWDNFGSNVYLDNAQYALVDGNFIYSTGNPQYFRGTEPSPGITVANETYTGGQNLATDLTITNNIVVRCKSGFVYYNSQQGGGLHNTLIANNTFYHSYSTAYRLIYIENGNHDTTVVSNNIFYQRSDVGYAWAPTTGFTWRTNNWYGGRSATHISGTNDVLSDPLLVNAGGAMPADYKLTATSPVKTAGTTESAVTHDHFGTARTASYSIGAHEQ